MFLNRLGQALVYPVQVEANGVDHERQEHERQLRVKVHVYERAAREDRDEKHEHVEFEVIEGDCGASCRVALSAKDTVLEKLRVAAAARERVKCRLIGVFLFFIMAEFVSPNVLLLWQS